MARCQVAWPNEEDLPMSMPRWGSMEEPQAFLWEIGMWHAIYEDDFKGQDTVTFTTGMRDHILQTTPSAYYKTLIPILSGLVGDTVQ